MKTILFCIALLTYSLSAHAQKAYGSDSHEIFPIRNRVLQQKELVESHVNLLMLKDAFILFKANNEIIFGILHLKNTQDKDKLEYEYWMGEGQTKPMIIRVSKFSDKTNVFLACSDFILSFDTNDKEYL